MSSNINLANAVSLEKSESQTSLEKQKARHCTTDFDNLPRAEPLFEDKVKYDNGLVRICKAFDFEEYGDRAYGFCGNIGIPVYIPEKNRKVYTCNCKSKPE